MSEIALIPASDVTFDDNHLADPPRDADQLYERWRAGLIRRHICADGKLDENTFLVERVPPNRAARVRREEFSRRRSSETWTVRGQDPGVGIVMHPVEKTWWPIASLSEPRAGRDAATDLVDHSGVLGTSFGGGDNPILSGGMALAMFSMEARAGWPHSLRYAKMLFSYLASCEVSPGFFERRTGSHVKTASTDELLGLVLGLLFYYRALQRQNAAQEAGRVRAMASRLGNTLSRHGYWCLPESSDYHALFYAHREPPPIENQRTYVFAHPIRKALEYVTGGSFPARWDDDEFLFYFGYPVWDPERAIAWPPPVFPSTVAFAEADAVRRLRVSSWPFFGAALAAVAAGKTVTDAVAAKVNEAVSASAAAATGGITVVLDWIGAVDLHVDVPTMDDAANYNFHMLAEACSLLLELYSEGGADFSQDRAMSMARALEGVLRLEQRGKNSFFAAVAGRARILAGGSDVGSRGAVANLVSHDLWQHDLPLGRIQLLEHLQSDTIPEDRDDQEYLKRVRRWLDGPDGIPGWKATIQAWQFPYNYNWRGLMGEARGWEHWDNNRVYAARWSVRRCIETEGPGFGEFLRYFFAHRSAVTVEACGLDLLFTRMLAAHWGLLPVPVLRKHVLYATAPYYERQYPGGAFEIRHSSLRRFKRGTRGPADVVVRPEHGRFDDRQLGGFAQDFANFPYRRFRGSGSFVNLDVYWIGLYEGRAIGGNGRYRGRRNFRYGLATEYFVEMPKEWDFRLQFATDKRKVRVASWVRPWINESLTDVNGTHLWRKEAWRDSDLPPELHSTSFCFYRVIGRKRVHGLMAAKDSVGNEYLLFAAAVHPYVRRLHRAQLVKGDRSYVLNPHTGVIHDVSSQNAAHLSQVFRTGNALLLPLESRFNLRGLSQPQLECLIGNIADSGRASITDTNARYPLQRRDDYCLPWKRQTAPHSHLPYPRWAKYLADHPAALHDYEQRNRRSLRLCSMCFPPA